MQKLFAILVVWGALLHSLRSEAMEQGLTALQFSEYWQKNPRILPFEKCSLVPQKTPVVAPYRPERATASAHSFLFFSTAARATAKYQALELHCVAPSVGVYWHLPIALSAPNYGMRGLFIDTIYRYE